MSKDFKTIGKLIFRNTIFNLIGKAIPLIVGIISLPFIISGLGIEQFGILSIVWVALLGYFDFFDFGLGESITKFTAEFLGKEEKNRLPQLFWTSLIFAILLGILGTIVVIIMTPLLVNKIFSISPELINTIEKSFFVLAFAVPLVTTIAIGKGILGGMQRYDLINFIKIPLNSLLFLIPVFCLLFGLGLLDIILFLVAAQLIGTLIYLSFCFKILPVIRKFSLPEFKDVLLLFAFGKWLTISKILLTFLVYIDRFLIGAIISVAVIGFYTVPLDAVARILVLPESLIVLFPVFSSFGQSRKNEASFLYTRFLKHLLVIMGMTAIIIVFFAPDILSLWLGNEFKEKSTTVLQLLSVGIFALSFSLLGQNLIKGFGRADILAKLRLIEVPFFFVAFYFFISNFGIQGAALIWMSWAVIDALIITLTCFKLLSMSKKELRETGFACILIFLLSFGVIILIGKFFFTASIFLSFVILTIIAFIFIWRYHILDYRDVKFFKSIIKR